MTSPQPAVDINKARDELLEKFEEAQQDLGDNTAYYESERRPAAIGVATPPQMQTLLANVGYPRLYVNAITERLELEGFRIAGKEEADEELWAWWQMNDLDVESTLGHTEALVHGRSYVTISAPDPKVDIGWDPKVPIIRVESPTTLYATIDPRTRQITQAIRAIKDEEGNEVIAATLYLPLQTVMWQRDGGQWALVGSVPHNLGIVPVVPLANRIRISDLVGTSEITPELRSVTDAAARIMMNMQATAELMAVPQRLLFGVKKEDLGVDPETGQQLFDAYLARILGFEDPEGKAQQFSAAELRNFTEALQEVAKQAAAYTGLPPQYLSVQSDNPASAEAIRASESRLVTECEHKAKLFGGAWEQVMRVAWKVMNGGKDIPPEMYRLEAIWRDPSTPTYAAKADAASKLYANGTGVIPKERARMDMGYTVEERRQMKQWDEEEDPMAQLAGMYAIGRPPTAKPPAEEPASEAA
ncbi:Phage portal protein, SPP1 Gp6-like [Nocardia farcinica]|uniref:phage portal protein n=1 Tax=Nocardia farcinica TaxID=37329 RepID=UPI000E0576A3|nr:phage portal protein [Nocardia farcinica]SUE29599.1 Phage portal protein, SPP1 Gp6-like [Nocardia farcinica]